MSAVRIRYANLVRFALFAIILAAVQTSLATGPPAFDCYGVVEAADQPCKGNSGCSGCYPTEQPNGLPPSQGSCDAFGILYTWQVIEVCVSDPDLDDGTCQDSTVQCKIPYQGCILMPVWFYRECINIRDWPPPHWDGGGACFPNPQAGSCRDCTNAPGGLGVPILADTELCP
jgi:hypothetical protein